MERKRSFRRRARPPLGDRVKGYFRKFVAFMFSNVGIIGLVVAYTIAGAFMFIAIEGDESMERWNGLASARKNITARLWDVSCCVHNTFNESAFRDFVSKELWSYQELVVRNARGGWPGGEGGSKQNHQWSFSGAFLFSLTVITTIGYGHIAPHTEWGKVATIFYAIIGMPLFLLYLSNIGDILARSFKWTYAKCCLCRVCPSVARRRAERISYRDAPQWRLRNYLESADAGPYVEPADDAVNTEGDTTSGSGNGDVEESSEDTTHYDPETVTVPLTLCLAIMVGYIFFGATLFSRWENWDIVDGPYFCFISLSSIGFGDIVPGDKITSSEGVELSFILCAMYLMLGMALLAMCFNLMQEQVIHRMRVFRRGVRRLLRCDSGRTSVRTGSGRSGF